MAEQIEEKYSETIETDSALRISELFGPLDENINLIRRETGVDFSVRENELKISGDKTSVQTAQEIINAILTLCSDGRNIDIQTVTYVISMVRDGLSGEIGKLASGVVCITAKGKPIKPKTFGQKKYIDAIQNNPVTIGIGPAGTGKTYLAVAAAVAAFKRKEISRIILTRPAVEAGESLGFLPGDLQNKVDPYLRPLYDALFDMLGADTFQRYMEKNSIEVAPLAFMRGRTLDDSFIILDEAQNTTPEQMKMFLTRLGAGSRAVVTGDITQIDLPSGKKSGLKDAMRVLAGVEGIASCILTKSDVVRHELVQRIVNAYEKAGDYTSHSRSFKYKRGGSN